MLKDDLTGVGNGSLSLCCLLMTMLKWGDQGELETELGRLQQVTDPNGLQINREKHRI